MILYASSPGHEIVAALGILLAVAAVMAVRVGRRHRRRPGGQPPASAPSAMVDTAEPVAAPAIEPPVAGTDEPRVEVFGVAARRKSVHNSRFGRGPGSRRTEGARHFATAPANRR